MGKSWGRHSLINIKKISYLSIFLVFLSVNNAISFPFTDNGLARYNRERALTFTEIFNFDPLATELYGKPLDPGIGLLSGYSLPTFSLDLTIDEVRSFSHSAVKENVVHDAPVSLLDRFRGGTYIAIKSRD